jgi:septum site-determining protein MinC
MSGVSEESAPAAFELRSASLTAVALMLKTTDLDRLAAALAAQFGDTPSLFDHDPVVVDLTQLGDDSQGAVIDFTALAELLRRQRLLPAAVRGGSDDQKAAALAAGLGEAALAETRPVPPKPRAPSPSVPAPAEALVEALPDPLPEAAPDAAPETLSETAVDAPPEPIAEASAATTLTVDKPLRSGQQVYAKGGDLVVLAAVNPGAEVIADGNIHVYGPLRGRAVAGAKGNTSARIFSTCMEPELVAIAGTYRTTENPLPEQVLGKTAQIRLDGDRLVFEPL